MDDPPPPQFPFERWVDGAQPAAVFQAIRAWLLAERAKVKEEQPPARIKALQGRRRFGWGYEIDAQKWLEFQLVPAEGGVHLRVIAYPPKGAQYGVSEQIDLARENYARALEPLWTLLGLAASAGLPAVPPAKHWPSQLEEGRRMVRWGLVGVFAMAALFGLGIGYNVVTGTAVIPARLGSLLSAGASFVTMGAVFSIIRGRTRMREARKHLAGNASDANS